MFLGGVVADTSTINLFEAQSVGDSKKLTAEKRELLQTLIMAKANNYTTRHVSSQSIDLAMQNKRDNLNLLEIRTMAEIILTYPVEYIYIDAVGKPPYFIKHMQNILMKNDIISRLQLIGSDTLRITWDTSKIGVPAGKTEAITRLLAQNKADDRYTIVGAASIIAKVERDKSIKVLEKRYKLSGLLGSGYPNNQLIPFLNSYKDEIRNQEFSFIRYMWNWEPLVKLLAPNNFKQTSLFP